MAKLKKWQKLIIYLYIYYSIFYSFNMSTPASTPSLASPKKLSATATPFIPKSNVKDAMAAMLDIISAGNDEFQKEHNRPMTYAEMRARFG